jgi:hypothetical protein
MRRCLGAAFAQFEMRRVLRTVLENSDLRPATDRAEPIERRPVTVVPRHGTPAVLVGREPSSAQRVQGSSVTTRSAEPSAHQNRTVVAW